MRSFLLLSVLAFATTAPAAAQDITRPGTDAASRPFLLEKTAARVVVSGPVAHVTLTQRWRNPNDAPVDATYVFPLPSDAAVTDLVLTVGPRTIRAEMKKRAEARADFERARREGRVAALLDQERENVFAQQVANLMPGAAIEVALTFEHAVRCDDGACEYALPTVVGPRFVPARTVDPGRIDPPVTAPGTSTGHTLEFSLELDAGVSVHELASPSHKVRIERIGSARARVTLDPADSAKLDRDVRVRWRTGGDVPEIGVLAWRDPARRGEPGVFTVVVQPPAREAAEDDATGRELVFVLDCSGSMSGVPLEAVKNVVRQALRALRPADTFQIVVFSTSASALGAQPVAPTAENVRRALSYLDGLGGQGGTELLAGVRAALERPADPARVRIVAFLTDGYIGNENEVLREVRRVLGAARLFSFGIGSSVNRHLLERLAEEGRGASAFLGPREKPDELVARFVKRIATPVLTDVTLRWEGLEVQDVEPARIPDLFAGQPLLVHGRYATGGTGVLVVEGTMEGRPRAFRHVVQLREYAKDNEALARLWARARIARLEREALGESSIESEVTDLGLCYRLMTRWTSLVAVDSEVGNTTGRATAVDVPVELPEDVSYTGVFGGVQTAKMSADAVRSVGYVASPAPAMQAPLRAERTMLSADERKKDDVSVAFRRITLHRADGTGFEVDASGRLWSIDGTGRTLRRTLGAPELAALRTALAAVPASAWSAGQAKARLVVEFADGSTRTARADAPEVAVVVALLR